MREPLAFRMRPQTIDDVLGLILNANGSLIFDFLF